MMNARSTRTRSLLFAASLCVSAACDEDDKPDTTKDASPVTTEDAGDGDEDGGATADGGEQTALPPGCARLVNDEDCDKTKRPIVFVHGTVANGDSFAHPALILTSNGYCSEWIRAVEYHSLVAPSADGGAPDGGTTDAGAASPDGGAADAGVAADAGADGGRPPGFMLDRAEAYRRASADIDRVIAELREATGFDKVDLAGHSQGSGHGSTYARMNPDKVAHYVHLAGGMLTEDPGGVPTLCVSSTGDRPVTCNTTANVTFDDVELDHSGVASSTEAALEIYKFLNDGEEAQYQEVQCSSPIILEGRAPTFAENTFLVGAKVEIYELGDEPWERGEPEASYTIDATGTFGPFEAKPGVNYEFQLIPQPGDTTRRTAHAYKPPFKRTDRLLRFNFETKDPVASATSAQVNRHDSFAVVIPRSLQKAFLYPRDSLKINGTEVLSRATTWNETAGRPTTTVAYYLFDKSLTAPAYGPGDMMSSGESIISGAFVNSADMFLPADEAKWITIEFNGTTMKVPNWPSASQGASVVFLN
jgi:pimeloyl-ACP methyl ester carboxylesterase